MRTMFEDELLVWHDRSKRDLPWCGESDPYRIWISEIMLQQTRTETVKDYYKRFLEAFPDVHALAQADEDRLFKLWEGLGYYSRARNLHKAAKQIVSEHGGKLPDTAEKLKKLSGIGDYTAGAIASIAFGRREPAMDGNAIRVMSRVLCEEGCVGEAAVKRRLKEGCAALMSDARPGDFNQAMMGLGSMICVPVHPKCEKCPVRAYCQAEKRGIQAQLPVLPAKVEKKTIAVGVALVRCEKGVLLVKRPEGGLLAGLWAFPVFEGARSEAEVRGALEEMGISVGRGEQLSDAQHVFTHRIWKMKGWLFRAKQMPRQEGTMWADAVQLDAAALPAALKVYRQIASQMFQTTEEKQT